MNTKKTTTLKTHGTGTREIWRGLLLDVGKVLFCFFFFFGALVLLLKHYIVLLVFVGASVMLLEVCIVYIMVFDGSPWSLT